MHETEKFKSLALRLSDQVAHLTALVSKMQSSITQLQEENHNLLMNLNVKTTIPWEQTAVTTLIQPSPIKLFSSSPPDFNMLESDLIGEFDNEMNPFRTPIVSMTARVSDEDIKRYFEGGIDEVLPKPFDKQSVRKIIEQFFKLSIFEEDK